MWTRQSDFDRLEDARHDSPSAQSSQANERACRQERLEEFNRAVQSEIDGLLEDVRDVASHPEWWRDSDAWERLQNHVMERLCDASTIRFRYIAGADEPRGLA